MNITAKLTGKLQTFINNIESKTIEAGFLDAKNATIAAKNEFGGEYEVSSEYKTRAAVKNIHLGSTINIIPRPFMQYTFINNKDKWIKETIKNISSYKFNDISHALGEMMQNDIKFTILDSNLFESNPEFVQIIKGNNHPLIDSGNMYDAVTYEIQ